MFFSGKNSWTTCYIGRKRITNFIPLGCKGHNEISVLVLCISMCVENFFQGYLLENLCVWLRFTETKAKITRADGTTMSA